MNNNHKTAWHPLKHTFVKDEPTSNLIHDQGFTCKGMLSTAQVEALRKLYDSMHDFRKPGGGMFYSVYSRDLDYRKKVHDGIGRILQPAFEDLFQDYRSVLNSFIVKVTGPESEFSLHQDSTGLDETRFSCLSVWIPLQDTDVRNGCMCVVPHSHKMFSPYRGQSILPPFNEIAQVVRRFLVPIELKAGQILLFDNRLVHTSLVNQSGADRVAVMSGIFPADAHLISCYQEAKGSPIELIEQDSNFLLTYENFNQDCSCRPTTGRSWKFIDWDDQQMDEKTFLDLCTKFGVQEVNHPSVLQSSKVQAIIGEPTN